MSTQDDNSNNKLDQIKIKLEKRLAAIEAKKSEKLEDSKEKDTSNKKVEKVVPKLKSSDSEDKKKEVKKESKKKVIPLKQEIVKKKKTKLVEKEEEKKKGFLIYFIYLFILLIFSTIVYFSMDYMGDNEDLQKDIMHQRLSEFKNKHISDSIEMANLDNRIVDLQSKKMFDSISKAYEDELIAEAKKMSISVIKNYDFVDYKKKEGENNTIIKNSLIKTNKDITNDKIAETPVANVKEIVTNNERTHNTPINTVTTEVDVINPINKNKEIDIVTSEIEQENTPFIPIKKKVPVIKSPIYPGCEKNKTEQDLKRCLHNKMFKHLTNKFDSSVAQDIGLSAGLHQVKIAFLVDLSGYTTALDVRAENKELEEEAIRVVQTLPKMEPGTKDGKAVNTRYTIPIKFMITD